MLARAAALAGAVAVAACTAATPTEITVKTYAVSGSSYSALERGFSLHGPRVPGVRGRAIAAVETAFFHSFEFDRRGGGCRFRRDGQVGIRSEVTVPEWKRRGRPDPESEAQWDLLSQYANIHELGHIRISQTYAKKLEAAFRSATAATCAELEAKMKRVADEIGQQHARDQAEYDATDAPRYRAFLRRHGYTLG